MNDIAISKSTLDYPALFHIDTGEAKPLAEYYRNFKSYKPPCDDDLPIGPTEEVAPVAKLRIPLFTYEDKLFFYSKAPKFKDKKNQTQLEFHSSRYERLQDRADNTGFDDGFNVVAQ